MKLPFFSSFFNQKKTKTLALPSSLLLKELKRTAKNNNFSIFENITIYHHEKSFFLPLLIVDETLGIFLFEYKDWSYDDLKNAKIEKASNQESSKDTLAFEKTHEFIRKKFNELTHNDGVPLFNYVLMENLNYDQYKHLNDSFIELLPEERVIFSDSTQEDILLKLGERVTYNLPSISSIMSTLLIQYGILDAKKNIFLASEEQQLFIDAEIQTKTILKAHVGTGKTSVILLKAILEKLKNPSLKITIIKPTTLSCDILKKTLLDTIERAIITIDPTSIYIMTQSDFEKTTQKVDLLIYDDIWYYSSSFILELHNMKKTKNLIMVETAQENEENLTLTENFRTTKKKTFFHQANEHAKALQIIASLLSKSKISDILIVSNDTQRTQLQEDLADFINETSSLVNAKEALIEQNFDALRLLTYDDITSMEAKFVILMNISSTDEKTLQYAYNLSSESVYILHNKESDNLTLLRNNFESNKNS